MILAAAVLATVLAPTATLCVGGTCRPADDVRVRVAPVQEQVAGVIPAGVSEVLLADATLAGHEVTVSPSDGSRNIASTFALRCGDSEWKWSLPRLPRQAMQLMHPSGACKLTVVAADYKTVDTPLTDAKTAIALRRLPVISGSVIAAVTRTPIARADIFLPDGTLLTTTDASGRFRAPVDGLWPSRVRVDAIGRASRTIEVPKVVADVELPIVLSTGGSVFVTLAPPFGKESVRWEARRIIDDLNEEKARAGEIAAGQSSLTIDGLDSGLYRIVLMGEEPLQRIAVPVDVREGTTVETTIAIDPARLELEVLRGGKPYGGAAIEFVFREGPAAWRSKVTVDDEGRKAEEIWQRGEYLAAVSSWTDSRRVDGDGKIAWKLEVPDRIIRGRVTDASTGQPLANVPLQLELASDGNVSFDRARSGTDGTYEFRMVRAGNYSLIAEVDGYEPLRTPAAPLLKETVLERRDLVMQAASGPTVRVVNAAGMPMPSTIVYVATPRGVRFAGVTKDDGRLTLPIGADDRGVAYALPRSGSFGTARFRPASEAGSDDVAITVADGSATLEVHAVSTDGEPIGGMHFLLRVDGILLPTDVTEALSRLQGWPLGSDASGLLRLSHLPPGRYEIWPLASRADLLAVTSGAPPPAPVNVTLTPGHQVAQLTFKAN